MAASVGVVTTVGCPHCKRAKAALKEQGVPYQEADLAKSRDVLAKVKEATGQGTVPQIFIGGDFVGGASDLISIIDQGQLADRIKSTEGKPAFPDTISKLLATQKPQEAEPKEDSEVAALRQTLEEKLPRSGGDVPSFSASDLTTFLTSLPSPPADPSATLQKLLSAHVIAPLSSPNPPPDTYQLTSDARKAPVALGQPLNCHIPWVGEARSAVDVSGDLRGMILELYDAHLAPDGKAVDYEAMKEDPKFAAYVDATVELTKVDLTALDRDEKMAFFINVYNALIVHGTVAHGVPPNIVKRIKFFGKVNYVIGGAPFTADDIEHGVLRGNAVAPASLGALLHIGFLQKLQIPEGDARAALAVKPVDPRIHFALVCGAKSCPPIKLYTPDNLDEGLQDAGTAFCEGEVEVDMDSRTVLMSMIFKWYGGDFSPNDKERLAKIADFCSGEKREQLLQLSKSSEKVKLKYKKYDWSVNSK